MQLSARSLFVALVLACEPARPPMPGEASPGVVFPMHVAEGHGDGAPAELPLASASPASSSAPRGAAAPSAAPSGSAAAPVASSLPPCNCPADYKPELVDPPDPEPLRQAEQYEYTFRYEKGAVRLLAVRAVRYKQPIVTARRVGRFAFELWIGHELIDRVRFDFPLLGGDEPKSGRRSLHDPPSMASGSYTAKVVVPAAPRARRARLLDRATRGETDLPWPPAPAAASVPAATSVPPTSPATPKSPATAPPASSDSK